MTLHCPHVIISGCTASIYLGKRVHKKELICIHYTNETGIQYLASFGVLIIISVVHALDVM